MIGIERDVCVGDFGRSHHRSVVIFAGTKLVAGFDLFGRHLLQRHVDNLLRVFRAVGVLGRDLDPGEGVVRARELRAGGYRKDRR